MAERASTFLPSLWIVLSFQLVNKFCTVQNGSFLKESRNSKPSEESHPSFPTSSALVLNDLFRKGFGPTQPPTVVPSTFIQQFSESLLWTLSKRPGRDDPIEEVIGGVNFQLLAQGSFL